MRRTPPFQNIELERSFVNSAGELLNAIRNIVNAAININIETQQEFLHKIEQKFTSPDYACFIQHLIQYTLQHRYNASLFCYKTFFQVSKICGFHLDVPEAGTFISFILLDDVEELQRNRLEFSELTRFSLNNYRLDSLTAVELSAAFGVIKCFISLFSI